MAKVILQGHILVSDSDLSVVQGELQGHIELTRNEQGCLLFEVTQDPENKNVFSVHEEFVDQLAFEAHQQRVKNSRWGKITAGVERYYRISEQS